MRDAAGLSRVIFTLSSGELAGEVTLTPLIWRVLRRFDGTRNVAEVSLGLKMEEGKVAEIAQSLFRSGVLEVAPGSPDLPRVTVNGAFLAQISNELARAMGPLAVFTLEEEIGALGETREAFPRDRIPDLVERLSQAIRDGAKRLRFQQVMLEAIRKL